MLPRSSRFTFLGLAAIVAVGCVFAPNVAQACGGCFAPPEPPTVVSGHRMVMSISQTQSVLWDQIQYSGDPQEFAWVLPVKPGARIEAGTAAFFEILESQTAVRVTPPPVYCGGDSSSGCGFVAQSDAAGDGGSEAPGENGGDPVEVIHQGTVGPYETVTLSTEEPGALNEWLESHGYNVDDSSQPIIDQYVEEGFDFIALRLQPGQGVNQMTPVRVVMEGSSFTLPLRMVGIGTGAQTPIILYVIGEGRYTTQNFREVSVNTQLLAWDFKTNESNYTSLRELALAEDGGKAWLPAFVSPQFFTNFGVWDPNTGTQTSLPQLYVDQAKKNGEINASCTVELSTLQGRVTNPCPPGEPWTSPACGYPGEGEVDARDFGCVGADDIAVALEGLHLESVWLTRLEANLPRAAFETDLTLTASDTQTPVVSIMQAQIAVNPDEVCGGGVVPSSIDVSSIKGGKMTVFIAAALVAAGGAFAARRSRRLRSA